MNQLSSVSGIDVQSNISRILLNKSNKFFTAWAIGQNFYYDKNK